MIRDDKEDACLSDHVDLTNNVEQAMDVALLNFGRWAFGDVDNEGNWILILSSTNSNTSRVRSKSNYLRILLICSIISIPTILILRIADYDS